jgi:hypothetical protein
MKTIDISKNELSALRSVGCLILAIAAVLLPPAASAQSSSSAVNGVVTDSNQSVIAGAKVTLKNVDTNVERATVTNNTGDYFFSGVVPARYTLSFVQRGFQTETISAFEIGVAQAVTLNATLKVGSVTETVTVQAAGVEVESSTAQLGTVIGEQQVNNLPLDGRNFTQLLTLTPGVTPISTGQNSSASNTDVVKGSSESFPSINGAGNRSTIYLTDGLNNNQAWYNTYATPPIIDMVEEFKVNSHNDSVYGGSLGGTVNVITKAGTNSYHGSAWEFIRTNSFDANPYFKTVTEASYHLNTFGGQMGGPIRIPHLYNGTNKTFFEIGMEGTHYSQSSRTNYLEPTAAQLGESTFGGAQNLPYLDFGTGQTGVAGSSSSNPCATGATVPNPGPCQLYDPTIANNATVPNRPAYLGNQIPVSEVNPFALAFAKAIFTQAPIVIPGIAPTTYNQQITDPSRQATYNYSGRIDQHIGAKDFIFFRYAGFDNTAIGPSTLPTLFSTTLIPSQQYGVSWLHVFNPSTSLQVQYGKTHVEDDVLTQFNNHNLWQVYGCSTDMCDSFVGGAAILVTQTISGGFGGGEVNSPTSSLSSIHEWSGSVSKTIKNHQLQAGGGWDEVNYTAELRQGSVGFTGASTANFGGAGGSAGSNPSTPAGFSAAQVSAQSGFGLADFLLDYPNNENKRNVLLTERPGGIGSAYLQDSWKVTPSLTLNFGIRYDRSVIPAYGTEASIGLQGSIETGDFDFNTGNYIVQQLPPLCSVRGRAPCLPSATLPPNVVVASGGKILHGSKDNIGPRAGFAYRVNDGMSVRGGFGITYDNWAAIIQMTQNYQGSWPDTGTLQINGTNLPGTLYTSAQNPFAQNGGNLPAATPFTSSNVNYMVDPRWKNPYSEQYNFGVEQQLTRRMILELNYVGSASHRMDVGGYYNTGTPCGYPCPYASFSKRQTANATGQPFPYTVPEKSWDHAAASSSYNALQAMFRGNFPGLTYMISYTWSKTLDEGGDGYFGVEGGVPEDPYNPRGSRGPASFNIPQMFVANFVYQLPIGVGKAFSPHNRIVDYAIGNWQVNGIITGRSGQNFNVTSAGDIAETGNAGTYERANLVGNPRVGGSVTGYSNCPITPLATTRTAAQWFNPCAFATPLTGTYGDAGRNILQDQPYWDFDASIFRIFPLTESMHFKADLDAFNAFNHPVLGTPGTATTSISTFGVITSTASTARILQGSVKFEF